jgi:hypothetical protein
MLKDLDLNVYDIACIQEPYLNPVKLANASNLRQYWDVIYLTDHHTSPERLQVIMLINKKLSKNNWHTVTIKSSNIMAIELTGNFGKVHMYNIYNTCDNDNTLTFLEWHMAMECNTRQAQRCREHRVYLLILRSYRLKSPRPARSRALRLSPHTRPPLVLADLLVSYFNCYESVHFGTERAPYI